MTPTPASLLTTGKMAFIIAKKKNPFFFLLKIHGFDFPVFNIYSQFLISDMDVSMSMGLSMDVSIGHGRELGMCMEVLEDSHNVISGNLNSNKEFNKLFLKLFLKTEHGCDQEECDTQNLNSERFL
jgi:hypothetical protein